MEKKNFKSKMKYIISILSLIIFSSLSIITFAWFTDKEAYTGQLNFGTIELDVSGTSIDSTNKKLKFTVDRTQITYTSGGNIMPGDVVSITFNVGLTSKSESAYYIVQITDDKNIFNDACYYSQDGSNFYVREGSTIHKQGSTTAVTTPIVGKLAKGNTTGHSFTISAQIDKDLEEDNISTNVECNVYAIQQANLSETEAFKILNREVSGATLISDAVFNLSTLQVQSAKWQSAFPDILSYTKIGFYKKGSQPSTVSYNQTLTTAYNNVVTNEDEKGLIDIYTNGTTELAFVSAYKIYAPKDSTALFAICKNFSVDASYTPTWDKNSVKSFVFDNFYTNRVTNMSCMFALGTNITSLDLTSFKTSRVTTMELMFRQCVSMTSIDLSSFDTSSVENVETMFDYCFSLTSLDLTSFDTSKITNFAYMFCGCKSLTSLDLSGFDTSSATRLKGMFYGCSGLTNHNLTSFDTSNVTDVQEMFYGCSGMRVLNLSSFNTKNVTAWTDMFSGIKETVIVSIGSGFTDGGTAFTKETLCSKTGLTSSAYVFGLD